jgi:hypothetical protein
MIISTFHWILLILSPLYMLLGGSERYYDLILALIVMIPIHWSFFNHECIISYFHKKANDCDYTLGTTHEIEDISAFNNIPAGICSTATILIGLYITMKLHYSVPLYVLVNALPRLFKGNTLVSYTMPFVGFYFLRHNQYVVPLFILAIASSCIVKHKDQNSCIVGTQVSDPGVESKHINHGRQSR